MRRPQQRVFVNGTSYDVMEHSGYISAALNGRFGWNAVWAETYTQLVRRIKQVLSGGGQ